MSDTDLTFITNEGDVKLYDRFATLIKNTQFFDCLVGYFYSSGFHTMYKSLDNTEKIRILIGISTDKKTYDMIQISKDSIRGKIGLHSKEIKDRYSEKVINEFSKPGNDSKEVEDGIQKFIEWINSEKLEIKVYPKRRIHAKMYIFGFKEGNMDDGRVITGSSNFTKSGLIDNLEFNVELKDHRDYEFAKEKFEELWKESVDVTKE